MRGRPCEEGRGFKSEASAVADGGAGHGDKVSGGKREPIGQTRQGAVARKTANVDI